MFDQFQPIFNEKNVKIGFIFDPFLFKRSKMVKIHQKNEIHHKWSNFKRFLIIFYPFQAILTYFQFNPTHFQLNLRGSIKIQIWLNRICCVNVKSDDKFGSKIQLKSNSIMTFFEILTQVDFRGGCSLRQLEGGTKCIIL